MTARFHLGFPAPSIESVAVSDWDPLARLAETLGFDCLWHSNERFYREMFIRMTVSTAATSRIGIGGAVVDPFAVHPALTAQSVATLGELSAGRATVAMGAGGSGFPMMGIRRRRPATATREAYQVMTAMLRGETTSYAGEFVQAHAARLHFAPVRPTTVWIASRGDIMLKLGGEIADAVMIATHATADNIQTALGMVEDGIDRAGRTRGSLRLMTRVDTCVHPDPAAAYAGCRLMVAKLLWASYPDRAFVRRAGLTVPAKLEEMIATRDYDLLPDGARLVPDEFVDALCWAGPPDAVADRVVAVACSTAIREFGFWILRAPGQSLEHAVELVANEVVPRVRSAVNARTNGDR